MRPINVITEEFTGGGIMKYANKKTPARSSEYVLSEDEKDV